MKSFTATLTIGTDKEVTAQQMQDALVEAMAHLRDTNMAIGPMLQMCFVHVEAEQ